MIQLDIDLWEFECPEESGNDPATKYHTIRVTKEDIEEVVKIDIWTRGMIEEIAADRYWREREEE